MFCPFLSAGKNTRVECDKDCALFNGAMDGSRKECVLFSLGIDAASTAGHLRDISKIADEAAGTLIRIELDLNN